MLKNILENQSINVLGLYDMLRKQKQLSTITPTGFPVLRNGYLPQKDISKSVEYILLKDMSYTQFIPNKQRIFDTIVNYLRLLFLRGFYVKGSLLEQVVLSRSDTMIVQLYPNYITRHNQTMDQIVELANFLQLDKKLDTEYSLEEFLFPHIEQISKQVQLEDIVCQLKTIDGLVAQNNVAKVVIDGQKVIQLDEILRYLSLAGIFNGIDLSSESVEAEAFWCLMSRFCLQRQAVRNFQYLPVQLNDYVVPGSNLPQPHAFQPYTVLPWRDMLRMILGIYPGNLELYFKTGGNIDVNVNQSFIEVAERLPIWYAEKFKQLLLCSQNIQLNQSVNFDLLNLQCPLESIEIKRMCDYYA